MTCRWKVIKTAVGLAWLLKSMQLGQSCTHLTRVRHRYMPTPYATSNTTLYAHKNSIDIELMGDNNNWYKWLVLKSSNIPRAGNGLFTARAFLDGDVITKYLGNVTRRPEKVKSWRKDQNRAGYILQVGNTYISPQKNEHLLFAHFINEDIENANCEINGKTGIITAKCAIRKGEELTLNYGEDYKRNY